MKKIITGVLLSAVASTAMANDVCQPVSDLAAIIMESRQKGMSAQQLMKISKGDPLAEMLVMEAFEVPRWSNAESQNTEVVDFASEVYIECLKDQK